MTEGPDVAAIKARLEMYQARLQKGDGDGSLVGALYIIAKSGFSDIASLLEALEEQKQRTQAAWDERNVHVRQTNEQCSELYALRGVKRENTELKARVERYEKALDGWFAPDTWRIADGSEVGVPDGALIQGGVQAALTKQEEPGC